MPQNRVQGFVWSDEVARSTKAKDTKPYPFTVIEDYEGALTENTTLHIRTVTDDQGRSKFNIERHYVTGNAKVQSFAPPLTFTRHMVEALKMFGLIPEETPFLPDQEQKTTKAKTTPAAGGQRRVIRAGAVQSEE